MAFSDFLTTEKGTLAEQIVLNRIKPYYNYYIPAMDRSHVCDFILVKEFLVMCDVKCKRIRDLYPDTGFDRNDYEKYLILSKNTPFYVYMVDEKLGKIYGNFLSELKNPIEVTYNGNKRNYPLFEDQYVYFHYSSFKNLWDLTEKEIYDLERLNTSEF